MSDLNKYWVIGKIQSEADHFGQTFSFFHILTESASEIADKVESMFLELWNIAKATVDDEDKELYQEEYNARDDLVEKCAKFRLGGDPSSLEGFQTDIHESYGANTFSILMSTDHHQLQTRLVPLIQSDENVKTFLEEIEPEELDDSSEVLDFLHQWKGIVEKGFATSDVYRVDSFLNLLEEVVRQDAI